MAKTKSQMAAYRAKQKSGIVAKKDKDTDQKATNAVHIENMNEAQLKQEISREEKKIASANERVNKYSGSTEYGKSLSEAFPMGAGIATGQNRKNLNRDIDKTVDRAVKATEAMKKRDNSQARLKSLKKALSDVSGTGKTQKQLKDEKVKKAVSETKSTLKWSRSTEGKGAMKVTTYKSGDYEIRNTDGMAFIYKEGKRVGYTDSLKKAKAFVEKAIK